MFAPVHLRAPRRDRALLTGSLDRARRRGLGDPLPLGRVALRPLPAPRRRWRTHRARGRPLRAGLGPHDRRDDAALERAARAHLPCARRSAASSDRAGRSPVGRLSRRLGGVRAGGLGVRSRDPLGRGRHSAPRRASPDHHRHDAAGGGPVAVQPAPGPVSRGVPEPAWVRPEPLARRLGTPRVAGDGHRARRLLRRLLLVAHARHVRGRVGQPERDARPRRVSPRSRRTCRGGVD